MTASMGESEGKLKIYESSSQRGEGRGASKPLQTVVKDFD